MGNFNLFIEGKSKKELVLELVRNHMDVNEHESPTLHLDTNLSKVTVPLFDVLHFKVTVGSSTIRITPGIKFFSKSALVQD